MCVGVSNPETGTQTSCLQGGKTQSILVTAPAHLLGCLLYPLFYWPHSGTQLGILTWVTTCKHLWEKPLTCFCYTYLIYMGGLCFKITNPGLAWKCLIFKNVNVLPYEKELIFLRSHDVWKPGMTDLWSVAGRAGDQSVLTVTPLC